ncbi:MAG: ABC transporter permease [Clostridium sp.]|jgi:putative ABC transport system permease protein|nr:ABC transporter permease [Clostridium sp.]
MAQVWEYVKIALMNIRSNKGRSFLTMLGIIIGISSVIMIISIGNGVKGGVNDELNALAGGQLYIYASGNQEEGIQLEFTDEDTDAILEKIPNVKAATPMLNFYGAVSGKKGSFSAQVSFGRTGLEYSSKDPLIAGRYFSESDYYSANRVCVMTESSAKTLFGTTNVLGMTVDVALDGTSRDFTIIGLRQDSASMLMGLVSGDTLSVEAPFSVVSSSYGYSYAVSDLLIVSESAEHSSQVARNVVNFMESRHNVRGKDVIGVQNFSDSMGQMNQILDYITIFVVLVAAISLLVGGIGVMNIMLVSVTERTREIGIRKALGARTGSILMQFLSESAVITLLGGIIGILIGVSGAIAVCSLIGFSATIQAETVLLASLFSSGIGIFFGIYPARKAARLSPIEALRHE